MHFAVGTLTFGFSDPCVQNVPPWYPLHFLCPEYLCTQSADLFRVRNARIPGCTLIMAQWVAIFYLEHVSLIKWTNCSQSQRFKNKKTTVAKVICFLSRSMFGTRCNWFIHHCQCTRTLIISNCFLRQRSRTNASKPKIAVMNNYAWFTSRPGPVYH